METAILFNIAIIFIAALVGGMVAEALKQSPMIGYIGGGILAGPYVSGAINNLSLIQGFADIGVILLMFTLGMEFSLSQLAKVKRVAVGGGLLQVLLVVILAAVLGKYMGLTWYQSIFLACVFSISSTMIVLRVLGDQGELNSVHGQIMIGMLIVQDLAVIMMVSILPSLQSFGPERVPQFIHTFSIAALLIFLILFMAPKIVPRIMERAARGSNNDIFLILALSLGLGVAVLAHAVGLSVSLGAFLAGLLISESDYVHEILGKIISLRDAFVILFFVSVGMMVNPNTLFQNWQLLIMALIIIIPLKFGVFFFITRLFGYQSQISFYVGMGMMQTGEFSFVMAKMGLEKQLISAELYNVILASTLISIMLTPFFIKKAPSIYRKLQRIVWLQNIFHDSQIDLAGNEQLLTNHVIICGYGRVGYQVGTALHQLQVPYVVIDYNYKAIADLRDQQIPYIYGDAANELVLENAFPDRADLAILALPDAFTNLRVMHALKKHNPELKVLSRAHSYWEKQKLFESGAMEVIQPEEEAGLQMVRHMILHLDLQPESVLGYLENLYFKDYHEIMRHQKMESPEDEILKIRSFELKEYSGLCGLSLRNSNIRETSGCSVVTIRRTDGEIVINPHSDEVLVAGSTLIVMGNIEQLEEFSRLILKEDESL